MSLKEADRWQSLTWDDLDTWAGYRSLERGRTYQRTGRVRNLARAADGTLLAWVQGGERYATKVALGSGPVETALRSRCTCPVGLDRCKHAVAVVVAYLDALKKKTPVPAADDSDPRWDLIDAEASEPDYDEDDEESPSAEDDYPFDDYGGPEEFTPPPRRPVRSSRPAAAKPKKESRESLQAYLEGQTTADLVKLILRIADEHPEVKRDLSNRSVLNRGQAGELIREARKEITRVTREPAWSNHWSGEGNLPDYSHLRTLLERLLEAGHADTVLDLGETLFEAGMEQVGSSDDEGETATQLGDTLKVVFQAVLASERSDADKLLYTINLELKDEYDVCHGSEVVFEKEWPASAWSAVADSLAQKLASQPVPKRRRDEFISAYRRDRLSWWLAHSLEKAGRQDEVLPLLEAEARITGSYERLVNRLIEAKRWEDAGRWAREGIEKTREESPGIAHHLQVKLREIAEHGKDWVAVAAYRAEEFFDRPSLHSFDHLVKAAERAGCGPAVKAAALRFLETGERPKAAPPPPPALKASGRRPAKPNKVKATTTDAAWPLPDPFAGQARSKTERRREGPHFDVLLHLALVEKRPDDVLHWYDKMTANRRGWGAGHYDGQVADAVAETHPERSLEIYRRIAESDIARTSPSAYQAALPWLRKVRDLLSKLKRGPEWTKYLADLREQHKRKRKLMETLDRLDGKRIMDS